MVQKMVHNYPELSNGLLVKLSSDKFRLFFLPHVINATGPPTLIIELESFDFEKHERVWERERISCDLADGRVTHDLSLDWVHG